MNINDQEFILPTQSFKRLTYIFICTISYIHLGHYSVYKRYCAYLVHYNLMQDIIQGTASDLVYEISWNDPVLLNKWRLHWKIHPTFDIVKKYLLNLWYLQKTA